MPGSERDAVEFVASAMAAAFNEPGTWFQFGLRRKSDRKLIGDLGVHFLETDDRLSEVGVTVAPDMQNQGFASEALVAVVGYLFGTLHKHRVAASIDPGNHASRRMLEKTGFRQEGHFRQSVWIHGAWADDVVFAVLRSDWERRAPAQGPSG